MRNRRSWSVRAAAAALHCACARHVDAPGQDRAAGRHRRDAMTMTIRDDLAPDSIRRASGASGTTLMKPDCGDVALALAP